jgi:hypothetical protein
MAVQKLFVGGQSCPPKEVKPTYGIILEGARVPKDDHLRELSLLPGAEFCAVSESDSQTVVTIARRSPVDRGFSEQVNTIYAKEGLYVDEFI